MSKLKPLVFSVKDLAYIDEPCATKNFQNPHDHAVYKSTEVDAHIADLEESHKKEVEQLLMKIAELEKLVETANKLLKNEGGFKIKEVTFKGIKLEGMPSGPRVEFPETR